MTQYRQILKLHSQGISQRSIAQSCQCSRNTVAAVLQRAGAANLTWPLDVETDADLERLLFPEKQEQASLRRMPDFEKVSKELTRSGVTLKLLWMEYCEECRQLGEQPFMYSQFCYHFQQYAEKERATMHIPRKPGDRIEVDWAGDKLYIVDRDTGEAIPVYLFVGVLPFSMYAYAEGCLRMDMENWIHVHVNMFQHFGGSAVMLVPDNLKTGVDHTNDWYTPQINRTYRELAEHYNTAVVPARVRKPKDKSGAEGTVGVVSTRIIASLRNRKFFSLEELIQEFNYHHISKSPAVFDFTKLKWMNGEYLKAMDPDRFYEMAEPYLREAITKDLDLRKIAGMVKTRIEVFPDIAGMVDFFETLPEYDVSMYTHKKMKTDTASSLAVLRDLLPLLEAQEDYGNDALYALIQEYIAQKEYKNGYVLWPIRTAVSGKQMTPAGATEIMEILGKEESLNRIRKGIELLERAV